MNSHLMQAKKHYDDLGYAVFPDVLDAEIVREAQEHIAWLMKKYPDKRPELLTHDLVAKDPFWVRLISDPRLLDIVEQFIGPNIALFASHYICKPPYEGRPVLWHQDGSYWPLEPMEVVTLWLAVDDSVRENGCLRVIPGTHTMQLQQMQQRTDIDNVLDSEVDPSLVDEAKAVDLILKAGSVSIHNPNIIHGSEANHSAMRRCGLTIRYIPTTTQIKSKGPWASAFLLRGEAVPGINTYLPYPRYVEGEHMPFRGCEQWQGHSMTKEGEK
ncbi:MULTISPECIES: phytanoyl-CoA dioxygenase family protein [Cohnella]|uniref:Ectoine hydroxylase-related dioxygenase (Phytanoyl-CoA dioxygenase family) n=1 Tax=Cohnella phaseoli TaxID=456490 RepID=A0A3D9JSE5_9BACL|nr:phytanoyl-CoA dioxygenase family protein [Cohnella phaseoli]RED76875.1 ectoine hydroxylase-related dioxygenase (phytanoyl-CoA dioxygenase family) [Cohnella phaseoli]